MKWLLPMFLLLCACQHTGKVYLKNQKTGQVVECGDMRGYNREIGDAQCIEDYKEQGYVRIPKP